ncbi:hypothetical protein FRC16_003931 [Serendipita sp. 398]|nr:hypothetical protein FRC16_003931 [Serendipita sp. 398]
MRSRINKCRIYLFCAAASVNDMTSLHILSGSGKMGINRGNKGQISESTLIIHVSRLQVRHMIDPRMKAGGHSPFHYGSEGFNRSGHILHHISGEMMASFAFCNKLAMISMGAMRT